MKVRSASFETAAPNLRTLPAPTKPEVAFVGRSNVGKSSLLNKLVGRKALARTSGNPGKTRELNFYLVNEEMYFVDLPGFGYAKVSKTERAKWHKTIGGYVTLRPTLRLVLHLIDGRHPPTALDREAMALIREGTAEYAIVMTKCDKLSGNQRAIHQKRIRDVAEAGGMEVPVIMTSSVDGRGKEEVLKHIWMLTR